MTGRRDSRSVFEPEPRQPENPPSNPYATPAEAAGEETQTLRRADVRALREAEEERAAERARVDAEIAAQRAALDATLRRPRDNRGNRKRRAPRPIAPSTSPPTAPRGIPVAGSAPAPTAPVTLPVTLPVAPPARTPMYSRSAPTPPAGTRTAGPALQPGPTVPAPAVKPDPAAKPEPAAREKPQSRDRVRTQNRSAPNRSTPKQSAQKPPSQGSRRKRRTGPILAMLLVVLIGFGLVVFGGLRATYLAPPTELTASLTNNSRVPVLATRVGILGLEGPRTRVTVRSASSSSTVFLGIGRAADVDAYLGQVNRMDLVGVNGQDQLLTRLAGSQPTLPDPASTDVWVVSVRAKGAATLVWPKAAGQWRLVAATDGKAAAPASVEVSWSGRPTETLPPVLIAIGFVLMVAGGVSLVMISSRTGLDDGRSPGAGGTAGAAGAASTTGRPDRTHFREGARL